MTTPTPDQLIRGYYAHHDSLGARNPNPIKSEGLVYERTCGSVAKASRSARHGAKEPCKSKKRVWAERREEWICAQCGVQWRSKRRRLLRGEVQESKRPSALDPDHFNWADVGVQLKRFLRDDNWRWPALLYVANAVKYSLLDIVAKGPEEFPEAPFKWTHWNVRTRVAEGRTEWTRRLSEARIRFETAK